jgi:hypothetical protein
MQLMILLNLVLLQNLQSFSLSRNLRMSRVDTLTRGRRQITSSHFHCYLLNSLDPKHKQKTYVGFTVSVSYEAVSFTLPYIISNTYPDPLLDVPSDRSIPPHSTAQRRFESRRC